MKIENVDIFSGEIFKGRVSHKPLRIFYIVISLFLAMAIIIPIVIGEDAYAAAAFTGGFALLMLLLVYSQASGRSTIYSVSDKGIYLKRMWLKDFLPFDEIEFIQKINEEETEEIALMKDAERVSANNKMDVLGAFKGQMDFGKLTQYSTVPFVGSESSNGNSFVINSHSIDTAGDFVYIKGKSEKHFLISPLEIENYLNTVVKKSKGKMRFKNGNSNKVIPSEI